MSAPPVPTSARAVGWFWLAGVPIGFVTGAMVVLLGIMAFVGAWQFFSLNNQAARAAFNRPPGEEATAE